MSDSTPVKNRLIPGGVQMMTAWLVNDGCDFVKFVKWCLVPHVLPHDSDVFANDLFKIRGWDETGLHVSSVCRLGGSIGTLVTTDADVARKPAEVNVEA